MKRIAIAVATAMVLGMSVPLQARIPSCTEAKCVSPWRQNTLSEDYSYVGMEMAKKNDYDSAIINFKRAWVVASSACERGFALAGASAATLTKRYIAEHGYNRLHPHHGQMYSGVFLPRYNAAIEYLKNNPVEGRILITNACFL